MIGDRSADEAPRAASPARRWRSIAASGALWPAGLFLALYLLPLGWRPMLLPDEHRYAEIPREMLASGDWVVPRLDGFVYFEKPVLGYWLTACSEALFGHNRFAVRLPSALAMGLTALLIFALVRRAAPRERTAAPLAAVVWLTCLLVGGVGTTAVLDGPLALFLTAALAALFLATESRPRSGRERGWLALSGVACGLAFLTKGFLALVVPALVAAAYLLWQRRWRDLFRMPWLPAAVAALVAAPWSLLIHLREPDFWRFFFWHEHIERFLSPSGGHHPEPWWLLLAATPGLLLPWTLFAPAAALGLRGERGAGARHLLRFAAAWAGMMYLFFSASSGKLLTYVLPAFPALALLIAFGLSTSADERPPRSFRAGAGVGAALFGLAAVGLGGYLLDPRRPALFTPPWRGYALVAALAAAAVLFGLAARRTSGRRRNLVLAGLSLVPFLLVVQLALPDRVLASKAPGALLARHRSEVGPQMLVISDFGALRAVCWVFERSDVLLVGSPGELAYGVEREDARGRHLTLAEARRLIEGNRGRVVVVAQSATLRDLLAMLPEPPIASDEEGRYLFVRY